MRNGKCITIEMEIIRTYWIFGVGFLAQLLFGIRIVIQWWIAEKRRESVSPSLFWKFSLAGSAIFLVYGILRTDIVIIVGQIISYVIYIRNLQLKGDWPKLSGVLRFFLPPSHRYVCYGRWEWRTKLVLQLHYFRI
ncbi:MAG: lipid-A-disaccharide synthase N-terminal domain-containing protein [Cyclobacteriaceae bacterium]|nr:MAG: lipid-A-disaccharide synthase N-terminal domain-containing protein [Cyclobacteriaceae bacterium]